MIRVLIVDDHQMVDDAIELLLSSQDDIVVLGLLADAAGVVETAAFEEPNVVLMDVDRPGVDGITATRSVVQARPETKVVLITALGDPGLVMQGIEAGAAAFVKKERAAEDLVEVIRRAAIGEEVFPADALEQLTSAASSKGHAATAVLTPRELEVLQGLADGMSTEELSSALYVSPRTVQGHVQSILSKLQVRSKLEAVISGLRRGLVGLRPAQPGPKG